jgi:uncharacterized protein YndB with AHSA1/START domain
VRTEDGAFEDIAEITLPAPVEQVWALLADTPRMVALDPLLVAYEPEHGVIEAGTTNRVTSRVGPVRTTLVSRTEALEPPHRAVFVSVSPSHPVLVRAEDRLEAADGGCRYRVTFTVTPTTPLLGAPVARLVLRQLTRTRRGLMERLLVELAKA